MICAASKRAAFAVRRPAAEKARGNRRCRFRTPAIRRADGFFPQRVLRVGAYSGRNFSLLSRHWPYPSLRNYREREEEREISPIWRRAVTRALRLANASVFARSSVRSAMLRRYFSSVRTSNLRPLTFVVENAWPKNRLRRRHTVVELPWPKGERGGCETRRNAETHALGSTRFTLLFGTYSLTL